jgi:CheY-like chemotaxis protein
MRKKFRILVVDDELSIRISLGDLLRRDGYQVEVADRWRWPRAPSRRWRC